MSVKIPDHVWELIAFQPEFKHCYDMGLDAELNGSNTTNCHFRLFRTPEHTKAWEAGRDHAVDMKARKTAQAQKGSG